MVCSVSVVVGGTLAKTSAAGVAVSRLCPTPTAGITCAPPGALSLMVMKAVSVPATDGVNPIANEHFDSTPVAPTGGIDADKQPDAPSNVKLFAFGPLIAMPSEGITSA